MTLQDYLPLNGAAALEAVKSGKLTAQQALEWERANEKRKTVLEPLKDLVTAGAAKQAEDDAEDDRDLIKVRVAAKLPENMVFTHPVSFVTITSKGAKVPDDAFTQRKIGTGELELVR